MNCTTSFIPYAKTGYFSKIVLDYISQQQAIQPFYQHPVSLQGIKDSIASRNQFTTDRNLLVTVLQKQYAGVEVSPSVAANITLLRQSNTYTICTAHQPNIFTGPLYLIYKILHAAKLAEALKQQLPENNFVPVYYMGSEDADLDELGHIFIGGQKYEWLTSQTGAVGRMMVDKAIVKLLQDLSGQLLVHPFGAEILALMQHCYQEGTTVEQATFQLVNALFADYGLVILLPDNAELKNAFAPVIQKELTEAFSHKAVQEIISNFPADYKVQASGRELNMFYLYNNRRQRIETNNEEWVVVDTDIKFSRHEIIAELKVHPERFSPNVILRPVFQEWVLPNIAFIGGGGEIAYWLQLKKVFEATGTPYPVLILRNSFMFVEKEIKTLTHKLKLDQKELFKSELAIMNGLVQRDSVHQVDLVKEQEQLTEFYDKLTLIAGKIDITLQVHTAALQTQAIKKLVALEKKLLRAEKRKYEAGQRQLKKIKEKLFPNNNLQERIDNLMPYYAKWGKDFIRMLYDHSEALDMQFGIMVEE